MCFDFEPAAGTKPAQVGSPVARPASTLIPRNAPARWSVTLGHRLVGLCLAGLVVVVVTAGVLQAIIGQ